MISIIIPARNERFLQPTIDDILKKATGEIEVLAVLDGYWPDPPLRDDPRVRVLHFGSRLGMRGCVNAAVSIARGRFILKCDAHVMFDQGFDTKLVADIDDDWVVVPRRWRLDPEKWEIIEDGRVPVDYHYLMYIDDPISWGTLFDKNARQLHGRRWDQRTKERMGIPIDETMIFQGSCWFMKKDYFYYLDLLDDEHYGTFSTEPAEICFKAWTSGGRVMVNKKTWYAHWHKGRAGRGFAIRSQPEIAGSEFLNRWLNEKMWHKQIYNLQWLTERFWPVPGWPEDRSLWKY